MRTIFGENIKKFRKQLNLLQKEVAEDLQVSIATISAWEKGGYMPEAAKINEIALYFKVTTDELLGMEPIKKEPVSLSSEENEILRIYRQATAADQNIIQTIVQKFDDKQKQEKNA